MEAKSYALLAAVLFAIIGLLQLARAVLGWEIELNGAIVPVWVSWIAGAVGLLLAWLGYGASRA